MIIEDEVFGEIEIIEPVLIELINSSEIQRLKNITSVVFLKNIIIGRVKVVLIIQSVFCIF